jgi:hypothetical protein
MECELLPYNQFMPAHVEARSENAIIGDWGRNRRAMKGCFPIWILVVCILVGLPVRAVHGEESVSLSGVFPSITTLSLNLALVSSSSLYARGHAMHLDFDSRFSQDLKGLALEKEANNALPKSLLRKQLVWVSEGPRAKVRPGFGEFFRGETVEPLRSNGAGVEDSRYLFVKFSFRF